MKSKDMHLYRGAPTVRSWSKYKTTIHGWTLCGVKRDRLSDRDPKMALATEDDTKVSCKFCKQLMR